jgi:hypothetical protein
MNCLPPELVGSEIDIILSSGDELNGMCTFQTSDRLRIDTGGWIWYVEERDIAAIGVKKPGKGNADQLPAHRPSTIYIEIDVSGLSLIDAERYVNYLMRFGLPMPDGCRARGKLNVEEIE